MKRSVLFLLLVPVASLAEDPFACVSPDVRQAFLPGYPAPFTHSTELPPDFLQHTVPDGSILIGSQMGDTHTSVVYKIEGDVDAAMDQIASSLNPDEWLSVSEHIGMSRGGFQTNMSGPTHQYCHDSGPTMLSIQNRNTVSPQLVYLSATGHMGIRSCADFQDRTRFREHSFGLANEMPALEFPANVRATNQGGGGGGDEYDSHAAVTTDINRDSLVSLLNDQIRDQGWTFDSSWSGDRSSGSSWSKTSADGDPMIGMLHAYGDTEGAYRLRFSINLDNAVPSRAGAVGLFPR